MQFTLRELRARKNLTQEKVAQDIGVSTATYNAWEQDLSPIKLSNFVRVANYFGVRLDDIFLGSDLTENQVSQSCESGSCPVSK